VCRRQTRQQQAISGATYCDSLNKVWWCRRGCIPGRLRLCVVDKYQVMSLVKARCRKHATLDGGSSEARRLHPRAATNMRPIMSKCCKETVDKLKRVRRVRMGISVLPYIKCWAREQPLDPAQLCCLMPFVTLLHFALFTSITLFTWDTLEFALGASALRLTSWPAFAQLTPDKVSKQPPIQGGTPIIHDTSRLLITLLNYPKEH